MKQISVTHLITTIEIGGAENQLLILIKQQIQMGYEVRVVPLKGKLTLKPIIQELGAEVDSSLIGISKILQLQRLWVKLKTYNGIVHCHLPQAEIYGNICAGSNSRLIASRHFGGQFYPGVNRFLSTVISLIFSLRTKKLISISETVRDVLISNHEVANIKKIVTVEYGFEIPDNRHDGRGEIYSKHANTNDHLIIGMVSRLSPEKRLDLALHAFEQFLGHFPNAKLIICGEGLELSQLHRLCVNLGINSSVQFVGKVSDIQSWYERFDIFLHTSEFEGFGMVYLEAMSNYLPIVTLTSAGVIDSLKDVRGITLVDLPQDSKAIAKSLIKAAKIDRESIKASYKLALTRYDPSCMAKKIERIYIDLT